MAGDERHAQLELARRALAAAEAALEPDPAQEHGELITALIQKHQEREVTLDIHEFLGTEEQEDQ